MQCEDCGENVAAYVDGELMPDENDAIRQHLAECAACRGQFDVTAELSRRLKEGFDRTPAPDLLKARIRASLAQDVSMPAVRAPARHARWGRLAAAGAAIALLSAGTTLAFTRRGSPPTAVAEQVLSSHIRSLMPGHLTDVASTNLHNVKPWFNGRLDLSPAVPRLDSAGFPLVGGRLDYIAGRSVAAVIYTRRQHVINVFSWPVDGSAARRPQVSTEKGYHLVRWTDDGGTEFWAASDLGVPELQLFVSLFMREDASSATK